MGGGRGGSQLRTIGLMRRFLVLGLLSSTALASVVEPFPGVKLVRTAQSSMVIASLCTAGVTVRATKYAERQGTPEQWAQRVGAQAAINADFFDFPGWTRVVGRARGNGEDWPADKQFSEARTYWQFGQNVADLIQNANQTPAAPPAVTEIVGGHNILIRNGVSLGPTFDGDSVITTAHRRTAIGLSKDRRTLFLFASNLNLDGNGLVAQLVALQQEAGGPTIDVATNEDGGGSSQLYVQGFGQVITSGRQVNNHLGIFAGGTGTPNNCTNIAPRGNIDSAGCDGVHGWAQDTNVPTTAIDAHVYFGGPAGSGATAIATRAGDRRADLCVPLGSCDHAFTLEAPRSLLDGQPHPIHAYAIDSEGGRNTELTGSPKSLVCGEQPPAGRTRHVVNGAVFAAWKFSIYQDVQPRTEGQLTAFQPGPDFSTTPKMIRGTGTATVYVMDEGFKRALADPPTAARWHLDLAKVIELPLAEVDALPLGPPLRSRPFLVKGTGPAIFLVDDALPEFLLYPEPQLWGVPAPVASTTMPMQPVDGGKPSKELTGGCASVPGGLLSFALMLLAVRRRR